MNTTDQAPMEVTDRSWSAQCDGQRWALRWDDGAPYERHLRFATEVARDLTGRHVEGEEQWSLQLGPVEVTSLCAQPWQEWSSAAVVGLFESLGAHLREIHNLDVPGGFGDALRDRTYQTFNGFMAAELGELSRRTRRLENEAIRDTATEAMASLRQGLSAFHPHGRSTWTVGRLTPHRVAIGKTSRRVEAILDFGSVGLRPPEYDLAALRVYGVVTDHPVARRAFWKGYKAAVTCDLDRRIGYFQDLIELERLLDCPAILGDWECRP